MKEYFLKYWLFMNKYKIEYGFKSSKPGWIIYLLTLLDTSDKQSSEDNDSFLPFFMILL